MNTSKRLLVFLGLFIGAALSCQAGGDFPTLTGAPPLVIGHRGASGYLPEHTLEAYRLAIRQGADFIEPDLVSTKDGVLIARHEINITQTTDVAEHPEFAARKTQKTIDGATEEGWFADDFTLAEIKTLRAVQRVPFRPQQFNGLFKVPTFREVIKLALQEGRRRGRPVGVYPETKHPSYHQSVGLPLERRLVSILDAHGFKTRRDPVIIQSFEVANLKDLNRLTGVRLVQLIDAEDDRPRRHPDPESPLRLRARGRSAHLCGPLDRCGALRDQDLRGRDRTLETLHRERQGRRPGQRRQSPMT